MDDLDFSYFDDASFDLGTFDDFSGFDTAEIYTAYDDPFTGGLNGFNGNGGIISEQPGSFMPEIGENIFDAFVGAAKAKLIQTISRTETRPATTRDAIPKPTSVGAGIFDAIYQYGKGRTELALESAIKKSSAGQQAIKNIEGERIRAWMPWIIGGAILLFVLGIIGARYARK
jgi:hypothetical protein